MQLTELLTPARICCNDSASSKKKVLECLSTLLAEGNESPSKRSIFDSLLTRERLGNTGLGHGVAIPHGRADDCAGVIGAFIKLSAGIDDFGAPDSQAVDLLFALLVPTNSTDEHLQILAQLADMFRDDALLERLRSAQDASTLYLEIEKWQSE